jgi:hypothetical protein
MIAAFIYFLGPFRAAACGSLAVSHCRIRTKSIIYQHYPNFARHVPDLRIYDCAIENIADDL